MVVRGPDMEMPSMTLLQMLERSSRTHPDRTAVVFMGQTLTYAQLYGAVQACMAQLQRDGIGMGQRVGLMLPNCPQYLIAYYAIIGLGAVVVQVNPMYTVPELRHLLEDAECQMLVAYDKLLPVVTAVMETLSCAPPKLVAVRFDGGGRLPEGAVWFDQWLESTPHSASIPVLDEPETVAVLQYTGGTTGVPKGAMLTHRNLVSNAVQTSCVMQQLDAPDVTLCALPFFHVYAMTVCVNTPILRGDTMVVMPRFDPSEALRLIQAYEVTLFPAVPTMYVAVSQVVSPGTDAFKSLRTCSSGGAPMPVQVMTDFEQLTGAVVLEGYGLSETSPVTHFNPDKDRRRLGSIGLPVPNTACKVVSLEDGVTELPAGEDGELVIQGPQVMKGYWKRPDETALVLRDGWFYTGDIARIDEDGFTYIVDRKKDMIIASGYNVYPRDVEEVLYQHPAVLEAAVVGVPDTYRGETVKAFVVLRPGHQVDEQALIHWCRERLAAYKVPRQIEFRPELPKTGVGKILRRALKSPAS
ncbi:MAG: long-chain fatty acid--CoA ligase [Alicyclobacillus sp.]|nr:long-chain fatty acid--CoA ligase [Alicyclobacillus sp.]